MNIMVNEDIKTECLDFTPVRGGDQTSMMLERLSN